MKESSKRENGCEAKDNKEIIRKEYSPAEKAALEEYDRRKKTSLKQVEFKYEKGKDGKLTFTQIGTRLAIVTLAKTTGTVHPNLSERLLAQATLASTSSEDAENLGKTFNVVLAALLAGGKECGVIPNPLAERPGLGIVIPFLHEHDAGLGTGMRFKSVIL